MLLTYRKPIVALFAILVFALTVLGVSEALSYSHIHVDAVNGTNATTGRGSAANPYKSITYALLISTRNNLPDPWHVHIHPGTYDADPVKPVTAREIFPLNFRSGMIFEGTTTAAECIIDRQHIDLVDMPLLNGWGPITIRNLTIQNSRRILPRHLPWATDPYRYPFAGGIVLHNPTGEQSKPSTLEACIIHNNNGGGVLSTMPLVLIGNTFSNNGGTAVGTRALREVTDNVFSQNLHSGIVVWGHAIGNISGNTFQDSPERGGFVSLAIIRGISYDRPWDGGRLDGDITDNTFNGDDNSAAHGIIVQTMEGNITDNKFVGHSSGAIRIGSPTFGLDTLTGDIARNTFTDNSGGGAASVPLAGGFVVGTLTGNVTHNTFTEHKITFPDKQHKGGSGGFWVGTLTGNVTDNNFTDNFATGKGAYGPGTLRSQHAGGFMVGTLSGDISRNIFESNSSNLVNTGGGFRVNSLSGNISHNRFANNLGRTSEFSTELINGEDDPSTAGGGFRVDSLSGNISHNIFDKNQLAFWLGTSPNTVEVFNNIFIDNTTADVDRSSVITNSATHFMNNLFVIDALPENRASAFAVRITSPECRFHNNIFSGVKTAIYTPIDLPITHNLFHNVEISFVNQVGNELGNDMEFWELFAVNATDNLEGDPRFVDLTTGDFHLQAASPAIDAGTNDFAPIDDLDGNARPIGASVDIGPYEFGGRPVTPPEQVEDPVATTPDTTDEPVQQYPAWDVNEDGQTDYQDPLLVAAVLEQTPIANPRTDVNGDGVVGLQDLTLVAAHFGESTAPAAPGRVVLPGVLPPDLVAQWLRLVRASDDGSLVFARSIANLELLLASLVPARTALLSNYPNPFNPETWIPYHLSAPAEVTLTIYDADGGVVRTLELGHRAAGYYTNRGRAAYWDGRNHLGELVGSGVYFYQLRAEHSGLSDPHRRDYTDIRRMVIIK